MIKQRQRTSRQQRLNRQIAQWEKMSQVEKIEKRRDIYLRRSIYWHDERLAKTEWKAKKVLGQGGYVSNLHPGFPEPRDLISYLAYELTFRLSYVYGVETNIWSFGS